MSLVLNTNLNSLNAQNNLAESGMNWNVFIFSRLPGCARSARTNSNFHRLHGFIERRDVAGGHTELTPFFGLRRAE